MQVKTIREAYRITGGQTERLRVPSMPAFRPSANWG
jgi:hypothetical protein